MQKHIPNNALVNSTILADFHRNETVFRYEKRKPNKNALFMTIGSNQFNRHLPCTVYAYECIDGDTPININWFVKHLNSLVVIFLFFFFFTKRIQMSRKNARSIIDSDTFHIQNRIESELYG